MIFYLMIVMSICLTADARGGQDEADPSVFSQLKAEYHLTDAQTFELLGKAYLQKDQDAEAEEYFNKAVSLDPNLYQSWYNLGLLHMENPEHYFKEATRANPKFAAPLYWLSSFYCKRKMSKKSIENFEEFLQVVDKSDPQEKDRIEMAGYFIKEMQSGNVDYNSIVDKAMSEE